MKAKMILWIFTVALVCTPPILHAGVKPKAPSVAGQGLSMMPIRISSKIFKAKKQDKSKEDSNIAYGKLGTLCFIIDDRIDGVTSAEDPDSVADHVFSYYDVIETVNDIIAANPDLNGNSVPWRLHHLSCSEGQPKTFTLVVDAPERDIERLENFLTPYAWINKSNFNEFFFLQNEGRSVGELSMPAWPGTTAIPRVRTQAYSGRSMMFVPFSIENSGRCGGGGRAEECDDISIRVDIPDYLQCEAPSPCTWGYGS